MPKNLFIDASHPNQTRVVLKSEIDIEDYEYEGKNNNLIKNNIYLGKVSRIEPSLQAAFVDFGRERHGFLSFNDIQSDYYQIPQSDIEQLKKEEEETRIELQKKSESDEKDLEEKDLEEKILEPDTKIESSEEDSSNIEKNSENISNQYRHPKKRYRIQEVIKPNQVILVQVLKDERGLKGAALTTFISIAGKYTVLMPNTAKGGGISRKIFNPAERKKIRQILNLIEIPKEMGLIVRTAGSNKTKNDIETDLNNSIKAWEEIKSKAMESIAPTVIFEESDIIKRSIRDMVDDDVQNIFVEGNEGYQKAKLYVKQLMPKQIKKVKKYRDKVPLFFKNKIESKLYEIYKSEVKLKSGGYLVINPTEALVSIDVNSGKSIKQKNVENTALDTNLEAAEEISRQIKIRDLSGLIIIDFIDMHSFSNRRQVERKLKEKCRKDRARIQIGRITHFGLLEMSRQRLRESNVKWTMSLTNESQALKVLKLAEIKCLENKSKEVFIFLNKKIIDFLSKNSQDDILFFQQKNKIKITFKEDLDFGVNDYKLEFKSKSNKIIETIQSEKIIKNETNIIKFEDEKKKYKKPYTKNNKKKFPKKYKKKSR
ncbi:Rne/Rng family ribonuclease [Candidatus Pelagibacter sp.]|nr:Rne/Rng family ribonuclease [Candidatus Pelagibacter sp.]